MAAKDTLQAALDALDEDEDAGGLVVIVRKSGSGAEALARVDNLNTREILAAIHTLAGAVVSWTDPADPEDAEDRLTVGAIVALLEPIVEPGPRPDAGDASHAIH